MKNKTLYIVVPCFNEEEVINETIKQLHNKLTDLIDRNIISNKSKIMFVDDGSKDKTWKIIKKNNNKNITGISLSRNYGHQNALLAGLSTAKKYADIVITMDADLQDDINVIDEMLNKHYQGNDIVYGVRSKRNKDSFIKRITASIFYRFMNLIGVEIINNHADYRLTSKRVLDELDNYKETNLFLRGIFPLIGYEYDIVYYERNKRYAGRSKYTLKKMLHFALDGITSFSIKPIRMITSLGFIILSISLIIMIYSLIQKVTGNTVEGWTFLNISIWFIGGVQMLSLGIIGEYIGKVYLETKSRPRYIIKEELNKEK